MNMRTTLRVMATLCFFAFLVTFNAYMQPAFAQCETTTDDQLVTEIVAKIKGSKNLASQISHINVASVNRAVKLQGWANNKSDYDAVVGIVSSTKCVKLINVNLFETAPPPPGSVLRPGSGGCTSGMKPCGDICIPEGDTCSIGP